MSTQTESTLTGLVRPYRDTELSTRVMLMPNQMNNDIRINLKYNLRKKVENKCNKYGYVSRLIKISNFDQGTIHPENFMAAAVYNVRYHATLCRPVYGQEIICKIEKMNKVLILAKNGPIAAIIKTDTVDEDRFSYTNERDLVYKGTGKKVEIGDFIKITVEAVKYNAGDTKIGVMGFLNDMATKKEVKTYYEEESEEAATESASGEYSDDEDNDNFLDI